MTSNIVVFAIKVTNWTTWTKAWQFTTTLRIGTSN